jgi:AraC-like DNA-binding protein
MGARVDLYVDRDAEALRATRRYPEAAIVVPLETTIVGLRAGELDQRLDRAVVAVLPARTAHELELPASGASIVATLVIGEAVRAAAIREYRPYVDSRRLVEVLSAVRVLPRTRWVDELVQRYVFEREVCEHPASNAARFLEAELTKEMYFLGCEQIDRQTRSSVLFEGDAIATKARAWIEEHLFEPFHVAALVKHCHASESTVLRAFRRELGVAPLAYLRRRRLEEAMQLLEGGRYAVTEVATRVGYDNSSAFAAAFRSQFGVAPSSVKPALHGAVRLPAHGTPPIRRRRRRS